MNFSHIGKKCKNKWIQTEQKPRKKPWRRLLLLILRILSQSFLFNLKRLKKWSLKKLRTPSDKKTKRSVIEYYQSKMKKTEKPRIKRLCQFKTCRSLASPKSLKKPKILIRMMIILTVALEAITGRQMLIGNCQRMSDMQSTWQRSKAKAPHLVVN